MRDNEDKWDNYYQKTLTKPYSENTKIAASLNTSENNRAIDCGCGVGADIAFLSDLGYEVFGFDSREASVKICTERFLGNPKVHIKNSTFKRFNYPEAGLVVANASLFFCRPQDFIQVWSKIIQALPIGGVFSGDFMGYKDSWANEVDNPVCPLTECEVNKLLVNFKIERYKELDGEGSTVLGETKHWHQYQVIAKKYI